MGICAQIISCKVTICASYLRAVRSYQRRRHRVKFFFLWFKAHVVEACSFLASMCACSLGMTRIEWFGKNKDPAGSAV